MTVFRNYTRTLTRRCADRAVFRPKTLDDLRRLFDDHPGNTYTLRAAGQSFDGQALPPDDDDAVLLFSALRRHLGADLRFQPAGTDGEGMIVDAVTGLQVRQATIEANAWATWGEIVDALSARHHIAYNNVTGRRISVAGSINADGLSQRSPIWGKEVSDIVWIRYYHPGERAWLQVYHPDSWAHRAADALPAGVRFAQDAHGHDDITKNHRLFHALVGGLGVLGPIVRAKYLVLPVPQWNAANPTLYLDTRVDFHLGLAQLVDAFMRTARARTRLFTSARSLPATLPPDFETYAGVVLLGHLPSDSSGGVARLTIQADQPGDHRPFLLWDRERAEETYAGFLGRHKLVGLMEVAADAALGLTLMSASAAPTPFRNAWCPYNFFFEAHSKVRDRLERKQHHMSCFQQSFSLPISSETFDGTPVLELLQVARALAARHGVRATATDLVYLPPCDGVLSATRGRGCVAATFGLEWAANPDRRARIEDFLIDVAHVATNLNGRVHLSKQVVLSDFDLHRMYGAAVEEFDVIVLEHGSRLTSALWARMRGLAVATPAPHVPGAARSRPPDTVAVPERPHDAEGNTPTDLDDDFASASDCA